MKHYTDTYGSYSENIGAQGSRVVREHADDPQVLEGVLGGKSGAKVRNK